MSKGGRQARRRCVPVACLSLSLAERRGAGVELEKVLAQPQRAALGRALEVVVVVDVHDAKALRVALAPLEVVFVFVCFWG